MRAVSTAKEFTFEYPPRIGIDLGTKFSRVAFWYDGDVVVVPNEYNKLSTPTCVAFVGHEVLIGEQALGQVEKNGRNTIIAPQYLIGCKYTSPAVKWYQKRWGYDLVHSSDGGVRFQVDFKGQATLMQPEEVLAFFLRHLRQRAEAYLRRSVVDVVLAVPSLYGKMQRRALLQVFRQVRLNVVEMVKAPTAAGLGFLVANPSARLRTFLVCDMGGALFDIAVLSCDEDGTVTERAITTEHVDLEAGLMRYSHSAVPAGARMPSSTLCLRLACEAAKHTLTSSQVATIETPMPAAEEVMSPRLMDVSVSQTLYETMLSQDVYDLLDAISYCLEDVGLEKGDIQEIIMVGGSSRIPVYRRGLRQFFHGQQLCNVQRPDHAVVLGAAVYAGMLPSEDTAYQELATATGKGEAKAQGAGFRLAPLRHFTERTVESDVPFQPSYTGNLSSVCAQDYETRETTVTTEPSCGDQEDDGAWMQEPELLKAPVLDDSCAPWVFACRALPAPRQSSNIITSFMPQCRPDVTDDLVDLSGLPARRLRPPRGFDMNEAGSATSMRWHGSGRGRSTRARPPGPMAPKEPNG